MATFGEARDLVEQARGELVALAPADWRSTAASAYADRLAAHAVDLGIALDVLSGAAAAARAHESEVAAARAALGIPGTAR